LKGSCQGKTSSKVDLGKRGTLPKIENYLSPARKYMPMHERCVAVSQPSRNTPGGASEVDANDVATH
jgi:hypothetical protein